MNFGHQYELWEEFLTVWPRERLRMMTLDQYSQAGSKDTFTYWIEARLDKMGSIWGGTAFKFGVFSRKDTEEKKSDSKLPYRIFDKLRQVHQARVLDPKRLGAALEMAKEIQAARADGRRNNTPNRRGQVHGVFILAERPDEEVPKPKRDTSRLRLENRRRKLA